MAIKSCRILGLDEVSQIRNFIGVQLDNGLRDYKEIAGNFHGFMTEADLDEASKIIYLSNFFRILNRVANIFAMSNDPEKNKMVEGIDINAMNKTYNELDSANDVIEFVNTNFIDPYLPDEFNEGEPGQNRVPRKELEENTDDSEKEENENTSKEQERAEQKALDQGENQFEEQEADETATIKSVIDDSYVIKNTPEGIIIVRNRASKTKTISFENDFGDLKIYNYNSETDTLSERLPGDASREGISVESFVQLFQGLDMKDTPTITLEDSQKGDTVHNAQKAHLRNVGEKFLKERKATLYGNSMTAEERNESLFTFMKDKFSVGKLARKIGVKNLFFKKIFNVSKVSGKYDLNRANVENFFGKGSKLFLKLSDDDTLRPDQQQVQIVVESVKHKGDVVLGNYFNTDLKDIFDSIQIQGDNVGARYNNFIDKKIKEITDAGGALDISEKGINIKRVFQPNTKRENENRVYEKDTERYGKDQDADKSMLLKLSDARILLEEMGYGVSDVYIDKYATSKGHMAGTALIGVSPFMTSNEINKIVMKKSSGEDSFEYSEMNREDNIAFVTLRGKELGLEDYYNLIKDNDTVMYHRKNVGNEGRDTGKKDAMFNVGQSLYMHFRIGESIPFIDEAIEKLPRNSKERENMEIMMKSLVVRMFSDVNFYSIDEKEKADLAEFKEAFNQVYTKEGDLYVENHWYKKARENFEKWHELSFDDRVASSRRYASRLFGYFPRNESDPLYKNKFAWALEKAEGDRKAAKLFRNKGGIFDNNIISFFKKYPLLKKIKINDRNLDDVWKSTGSGVTSDENVTFTDVIKRPTFNPVHSFDSNKSNSRIAGIAPLNRYDNHGKENVAEDYLELEWMPLMPHFEVAVDEADMANDKPNSNRRSSKRRGSARDNSIRNKEITSEEEIEYNLSQEEVLDIYNELLGDVKGELELMDSPIRVKDGMVIGQVKKDVMRLHQKNGRVSERVLRHEIMHRVVNEAIAPESRKKLYQEAKTRMLDDLEHSNKTIHEISDRQADEWIAETYESNYGNYGSKIVRSLPRVLKDFYFLLKELYTSFLNKGSYFDLVAEKLETGYFVNAQMNQNGYGGTLLNKKIGLDKKNLASKFHISPTMGMRLLEDSIKKYTTDIQLIMYGKEVGEGMSDGVNGFFTPSSYKKAIEILRDSETLNLIDLYDELTTEEKQYFSNKESIESVSDLFQRFPLAENNIMRISENAAIFYQAARENKYLDEVIAFAIPFYDAKKDTVTNDASAQELESSLKSEDQESGSDINHDKLRNAFERSEISSYGTFSERVKFFLYNTFLDGSDNRLVDRKYVDSYFREVFNNVRNGIDSNGSVTMKRVVDEMKKELDKVAFHPTSYEYRSVKAIYDRFFNIEEGSHSFLDIALSTDPRAAMQAKEHMDVLTAILSAQRSVIEQHFVKVDRNNTSSTKDSVGKDFKNTVKDRMVGQLFFKSKSKNVITYKLSDLALKTFFGNGKYRISSPPDGGTQINISEKSFVLTKDDMFTAAGIYTDFKEASIKRMASEFSDKELLDFVHDLGIPIPNAHFKRHVNKSKVNRNSIVALAVQSYLVLAKQYNEEGKSAVFSKETNDFIDYASMSRTDDISMIVNESLRNDGLSESTAEIETASKTIYSPTAFHQRFERIGGSISLNAYNKKDSKIYLSDGAMETVDKFPTAMHNTMNRLRDFKVKLTKILTPLNIDKPSEEQINLNDFIKESVAGVSSNVYRNSIVDPEGIHFEFDQPLYFKTIKNNKNNRSKTFNNMTDGEFHKQLLRFIIGKGMSNSYYHPMEIQADRGYLPLLNTGSSSRHHPGKASNKWTITGKTAQEVENIRRIPFHHSSVVMMEIYGIMGDEGSVERIRKLQDGSDLEGIKEEFENLNGKIDGILNNSVNTSLINMLTERKHYVKVNGKFRLSPNLRARMGYTSDQFKEFVNKAYLEFAEYTFSVTGNILGSKESNFYISQSDLKNTELDDKRFHGKLTGFGKKKSPSIMLASDIVKTNREFYDKLSLENKIQEYHPALYSMFLTFYINHNNLAQVTTGDPYLYKADKVTGMEREHSYMTDYSKRQGTFTTPKMEGVYREVLDDGRVFNKNGLGERLNVAYFNDMKFNSKNDNPSFHELLSKANRWQERDPEKMNNGFDQESTDGIIYTNFIFQSQLRSSYGGSNGMNIGDFIKFNGHSFDQHTGDLHLPKGLAQVITPEVLDNGNNFYLSMLSAQLSTAKVTYKGQSTNLWDVYKQKMDEGKSHELIQSEVLAIYQQARNNGTLDGDIVHFMAPKSTNKGPGHGINIITDTQTKGQFGFTGDIIHSSIGTDGFGIILDLQKDLDNEDTDISLSTQMMFLLGLNGDNYMDAKSLYNGLKTMSEKEINSIADDIANTFSKDSVAGNNLGFLQNKEALRKWFMKEIKESHTIKGDFGLIYELVSDFGSGSISHPLLFEEIYSKVASRISKSITRKVPGFKGIQVPAHNTMMLYLDTSKNKWITAKDANRMGIDPSTLESRNLNYSGLGDNELTDTEVISGNIFTGRYGMDRNLSLDEIFTININGTPVNLESDSYDTVGRSEGLGLLNDAVENDLEIDWASNPIFNSLLEKNKLTKEVVDAYTNSEKFSTAMNQSVYNLLNTRVIEMNRMLYGVMTRIPGTGKNSSSPIRIVAFASGKTNGVFTPAEWLVISGSDQDGDTVQLWNYDRTEKHSESNKSLDKVRRIIKNPKNAEEIFSMINLSFMDGQAENGKKKILDEGLGYVLGSLKTMTEIKGNNSVGTSMTGVSATESKVHAYSSIGRTMFDHYTEKLSEKRKEKVQKQVNSKPSFVFKTASNVDGVVGLTSLNTGPLNRDDNGDYKDIDGNFIYKWNETLTNAAIDNAKHLTMGFIGLNTYNSGAQQAMTFLGFSPEVIVDQVLKNKFVKEAYDGVAVMDDIGNDYRGKLVNYIRETGFETEVAEIDEKTKKPITKKEKTKGSDWIKKWYQKNQIGNIRAHFESNDFQLDLSNKEEVMKFLLLMEDVSKEIDELRKFIKATDPIPGKSGNQDYTTDNLIGALNYKTNTNNKNYLPTPEAILSFIRSIELGDNPLSFDAIIEAQNKAYTIHPLVLMATLPHIRDYVKRHLEFDQMKNIHILYKDDVKLVRNYIQEGSNNTSMKLERNRSLANKSIYKYISSVFLKKFEDYTFDNERFNLNSFSGRKDFRVKFAKYIDGLKNTEGLNNEFIKRLKVENNSISFPGSENMQMESKIIPKEYFRVLDPSVKEAFLLYELSGTTNHLTFKKGSYVTFMDGETFNIYNKFLNWFEQEGNSLFENEEQGSNFSETFFSDNPSINNRIQKYKTSIADQGEYPKGFVSHTDKFKARSTYRLSDTNGINKFKMLTVNNEEATRLEDKVEVLKQELDGLITEYNTLQSTLRGRTDEDIVQLEAFLKLIEEGTIKINQAQKQLNDMRNKVESEGAPTLFVVKGYSDKEKMPITRLYKTYEDEAGNKNFPLKLVEQFHPFDPDVNPYKPDEVFPKTESEGSILADEKEYHNMLMSSLGDGSVEPETIEGEFYIQSDFKKITHTEDGKTNIKQYSFNAVPGSPQAKSKAMAIANIVQAAFPNIKMKLVSGLTGVYGEAAGFVNNNTVYLNLDNIGLDTPIHEFAHIFMDMVEKSDPVLFRKISEMITKTKEFQDVSRKYQRFGNNRNDNIKETFVTMLGHHFRDNLSDHLEGLTSQEKSTFSGMVKDFIDTVRKYVRNVLGNINIDKRYINDSIIDNLDLSSDLNDMFRALSGAVVQGKVITDLSTREFNELQGLHLNTSSRATDGEVNRKINELIEKGIIKNYC